MMENLAKQIKRHLYGKPQTIHAIFPPGLGSVAFAEVKAILDNLWFKQKYNSQLSIVKNAIRIDDIHLFAVNELLLRAQCLTDIRLVIFAGKAVGKSGFKQKCSKIHWNFFINQTMSLKIKVDSVASRAFHESALRDILSEIVEEHAAEIVSGENSKETTCIYADLYQDRLTVSISLAGKKLYKRGYRSTLSASAPLREDFAASCIYKSLQFAKGFTDNFNPDTIIIPFSGTGTFAFEYLIANLHFLPALFGRHYAVQNMPLFKPENFQFLLGKLKNNVNVSGHAQHFYCIDNSDVANENLQKNIDFFKETVSVNGFDFPAEFFVIKNDFFAANITEVISAQAKEIYILLNPPYGIRLAKNSDSIALYKKIATELNKISELKQKRILGFILCPNEETWSVFCKNLVYNKMETYHLTQGGIDIRVCQFWLI